MKEVQMAQTNTTSTDHLSDDALIDETPSETDRMKTSLTTPRVILINETKRRNDSSSNVHTGSDTDSPKAGESPALRRDPQKPRVIQITRPPTGYGPGSALVSDQDSGSEISTVSVSPLYVNCCQEKAAKPNDSTVGYNSSCRPGIVSKYGNNHTKSRLSVTGLNFTSPQKSIENNSDQHKPNTVLKNRMNLQTFGIDVLQMRQPFHALFIRHRLH